MEDLTEREHEVLLLIAEGLNNKAIAGRLNIRGKSLENHISNIYSKLLIDPETENPRVAATLTALKIREI